MARSKMKSATDQRNFTLVYNDFLESELLNYYEKMIFIAIKKFADNESMKAFPSIARLHKMTGISTSQIKRTIASLEEKRVLKVEHRTTKEKGHQSNIYTLYDFAELWQSKDDEVAAVVDQYEENRMIELLEHKGYVVTKEKELVSAPTKVTETSTKLNQFDMVNTTTNAKQSQDQERYTVDQIRQIFDYEYLIKDNYINNEDVETVMNILYDALNTRKSSIRIGGEDKPTMVVISKLMKLTMDDIKYSVGKYHEQTERIRNVNAYLLTILYHAKEQGYLDLMNQGHTNGDF